MEAEILNRPPLSGDYEEHNFAVSENTLWVKFFDDEWLEWCGVFSLGWKSGSSIHRIPGEPVFLIVAGGQGYYVNVNDRTVIHTTEWDDIEAIIYNGDLKSFVVSDGLRVGLLRDNHLEWSTDRISLDGISFLSSNGPIVEGILNDCSDEGCKFEINVVSGKISSSWLFCDAVS